ncbi:hypothetical protein BDZ91DRAFT_776352 [Kalaharituber pfeilii]|nr:hypothetical protein BDZ91DRAFT_776352 [Kalaharituber pfeilii]
MVKDGYEQINVNFKNILDVIQEHPREENKHNDRMKLLEWLSPLNFWTKHSDIVAQQQAGTGNWILESPMFQQWEDKKCRKLFCPGMPGAGKTVAASIIINYLSAKLKQENVAIVFVYCNYKERDKQTYSALVGSIGRQLASTTVIPDFEQQYPEVTQRIFNLIQSLHDKHSINNTSPSNDEYQACYTKMLALFTHVYFVVDALDECEHRDNILSTLQELLRAVPQSSLLVTARDSHHIGNWFKAEDSLRLAIRADEGDVRLYLQTQCRTNGRLIALCQRSPDLMNSVIDTIARKADGMFLVAKLHIDAITTKTNPRDLRKALETLPSGLAGIYDTAMDRILTQREDFRILGLRVLTWVLGSIRPLTLVEFQHALAVSADLDAQDLDPDLIPDEDIVTAVCAGLVRVEVNSASVSLVHYTTQEYFNSRYCAGMHDLHVIRAVGL